VTSTLSNSSTTASVRPMLLPKTSCATLFPLPSSCGNGVASRPMTGNTTAHHNGSSPASKPVRRKSKHRSHHDRPDASAEEVRSVGASHRASPQQLSVAVRISHERGDFCSCLAVDFVRSLSPASKPVYWKSRRIAPLGKDVGHFCATLTIRL